MKTYKYKTAGAGSKREKFGQIVKARMEAARPVMEEMAALSYGAEDIGPKIGRAPTTARIWMRTLGIKFVTNNRKVFRYDREMLAGKILPLFRMKVHPDEIAKKVGVSSATVFRFLNNNGHRKVREHSR
jgi:DNA invertase Pin-like site-specific DNA recombinase